MRPRLLQVGWSHEDSRGALRVLVGFVALGAFFTAVLLVLLLVVAMCSARKRGAGFIAQQMVFHLYIARMGTE